MSRDIRHDAPVQVNVIAKLWCQDLRLLDFVFDFAILLSDRRTNGDEKESRNSERSQPRSKPESSRHRPRSRPSTTPALQHHAWRPPSPRVPAALAPNSAAPK